MRASSGDKKPFFALRTANTSRVSTGNRCFGQTIFGSFSSGKKKGRLRPPDSSVELNNKAIDEFLTIVMLKNTGEFKDVSYAIFDRNMQAGAVQYDRTCSVPCCSDFKLGRSYGSHASRIGIAEESVRNELFF